MLYISLQTYNQISNAILTISKMYKFTSLGKNERRQMNMRTRRKRERILEEEKEGEEKEKKKRK